MKQSSSEEEKLDKLTNLIAAAHSSCSWYVVAHGSCSRKYAGTSPPTAVLAQKREVHPAKDLVSR
jgi:hypothetical protein